MRFWIAFIDTPLETSAKNFPCVTLKRAYLLSVHRVSSKSPWLFLFDVCKFDSNCDSVFEIEKLRVWEATVLAM